MSAETPFPPTPSKFPMTCHGVGVDIFWNHTTTPANQKVHKQSSEPVKFGDKFFVCSQQEAQENVCEPVKICFTPVCDGFVKKIPKFSTVKSNAIVNYFEHSSENEHYKKPKRILID